MKEENIENLEISIPKDKLATLPVENYDGKIVVVSSEKSARSALEQLRKAEIIGFDTETKPNFKKGKVNNVSLIQLATEKKCFLFRISKSGLLKEIIDFLEDEKIKKVGLSIHDDFLGLSRIKELNPGGFIDLQPYVKQFNIIDNSLSRIYGILFGKRIAKGQQLTNWEASKLTSSQKKYAALDAYACIRIYKHLQAKGFDPLKSEYIKEPD